MCVSVRRLRFEMTRMLDDGFMIMRMNRGAEDESPPPLFSFLLLA